MSDERLEAGRHHLRNGNRAVQQGYSNEARSFFESALLQFRGPELRVGEAHALRGLAQVELAEGSVDAAERHARAAIRAYQELSAMLDGLPDRDAVAELSADALQGDAAARVVLAEVLIRTGRGAAARTTLDEARDLLDPQRDSEAAGAVWLALGRLALRTGDDDEARRWFERSLATHRAADDPEGQIAALLLMAEQDRLGDRLESAADLLAQARVLSQQLDHGRWEGRLLAALGAVAQQAGRFTEARSYFDDAVTLTREAGDVERHAVALVGLGSTMGFLGEPGALDLILQGLRSLSSLDNPAALAGGLQRLGGHARRQGQAALALAACEAGRRTWVSLEDPRGQVYALRHIVKALSGLRAGRGALVAAIVRERLVGAPPSNAHQVAAWFRERAPADMLASIEALDLPELLLELRREVDRALYAAIEDPALSFDDLGVPGLAVAVVERVAALSPAPREAAASVAVHLAATESSEAGTPPESVPRTAAPASEPSSAESPAASLEAPRREPPAQSAEDLYASMFGGEE